MRVRVEDWQVVGAAQRTTSTINKHIEIEQKRQTYGIHIINQQHDEHDDLHQHKLSSSISTSITDVTFHYRRIKLVLVLDLSPSLFTVSPSCITSNRSRWDAFTVLYSALKETLTITLKHLATSTCLEHSELFISVIGCTVDAIAIDHHEHNDHQDPVHVLIHGALLNINTLSNVMTIVLERLSHVERLQANDAQQHAIHHARSVNTSNGIAHYGDIADSFGDMFESSSSSSPSSNQSSLRSLVDCGRFVLDRLDATAAPSLVLITDGCLSCPNVVNISDYVMSSTHKQGIRLNILQITPKGRSVNRPINRSDYGSLSFFSYGYVPESSLLEFAARETGGVFYDRDIIQNMRISRDIEHDQHSTSCDNIIVQSSLSDFEAAVFTRSSMIRPWLAEHVPQSVSNELVTLPIVELKRHKHAPPSITTSTSYLHPPLTVEHSISPSLASLLPLVCERIKRMVLSVDMMRLIECRMREGFTLFLKPDSLPHNLLVFRREWQPQVFIEYQVHIEQRAHQSIEVHDDVNLSIIVDKPGDHQQSSWHSKSPSIANVDLFIIGSRALLDALYVYQHPELQAHATEPQQSNDASDAPHVVLANVLRQMFETDVMLVHLARLASTTSMATDSTLPSHDLLRTSTSHTADSGELAFTFAKSEIMRCPLTSPFDQSTRPSSLGCPSHPLYTTELNAPVTVVLPPIPSFVSSSYLSPSHELWQGLASMPHNLIACLFDCTSFDVIGSLHRRAPLDADVELELELELEIDFASLARVRSSLNQSINPHSVSPFNASHLHTPLDASFARAVSTVSLPRSLSVNQQATDVLLYQADSLGQQGVAETFCRLMQGWSSITVSNACFVHFPAPPTLSSNSSVMPPVTDISPAVVMESFAECANASLPFVLARLTWRTKYLVTITLAFHGCDLITRSSVTHSLKTLIECAFVQTRQSSDQLNKRDTDFIDEEDLLSTGSSTASFEGSTFSNEQTSNVKSDPSSISEQFVRCPSHQSAASYDSFNSPKPLDASKVGNERMYPFGVISSPIHQILLRPSFVLAASLMFEGFVSHFPHRQLIDPELSTSPADSQLVNHSHYRASRQQYTLLKAFMRHRSWHWSLLSADQSMSQSSSQCTVSMKSATRLIRNARTEEGFVLGSSTGKSTTWIRFLSLDQPASLLTDEASQLSQVCLLQYSVTEVDNAHIQTDLWMEPLSGTYAASIKVLHSGDEDVMHISSEELFDALSSFIHACDLHIISAVSTFDQIRDLEYNPDVAARLNHAANQLERTTPDAVHSSTSSGLALHLDDDWHASRAFSYELDNERRVQAQILYSDSNHSLTTSRDNSRPTTPRPPAASSSFWNLLSPESHRRMAASQLPPPSFVKHSVTHDDLPSMRSNLSRSLMSSLPARHDSKVPNVHNNMLQLPPSRANSQPDQNFRRHNRAHHHTFASGSLNMPYSSPIDDDSTEWDRVPLSLTHLLEFGVATVFRFSLPLDQLPDEPPLPDLVTNMPPMSRVVSSPPAHTLQVITQLPLRMSPICASTPSSPVDDGPTHFNTPAVGIPMLRQLHAWLIEALRSLADIELIGDRCFAQLVNEYTCIVIVLPRRPALNKQNFERKINTPTPSKSATSPITSDAVDDTDDVHAALDELLDAHGCQLSIVDADAVTLQAVFVECSRDSLGHPRAKPSSDGVNTSTESRVDVTTLTDGRSERQFRSHADRDKYNTRLQLVRALFASSVLAHSPPVVSSAVHRAVALALGLANVVHHQAPVSPALISVSPSSAVVDPGALLSPSYVSHTISEPPMFNLDATRTPPTRSLTQALHSTERLPMSMTLDALTSQGSVDETRADQNTSFTGSVHDIGSPTFPSLGAQQSSLRRFIHDVFVRWISLIKAHSTNSQPTLAE